MPVPVLSVAAMREWEQATWATGRTEREVIERVGQRVARRALRLTRPGDGVLILAGKGHNGDDARCAGPHLVERRVQVINVTDPTAVLASVEAALRPRPALLIDGLFGIGLNRPLAADWIALIEAINRSGVPVLAVDVPSGLSADTGEPFGAAIRARVTLTLGAPKAGLLRSSAWPFTGRLEVEPDIGLVPAPTSGETQWTLPGDFEDYPPPVPVHAHKGSFGHLLILAGSRGYHGAAVLAARGAQRARPGLITLGTTPECYLPAASQLQAVMVAPWPEALKKLEAASAVLCGPGLAAEDLPAELKAEVARLWREAEIPVIVDASGLNWLPAGPTREGALRVMTPHPGEAGRLLGSSAAEVQADRQRAAFALSRRFGDCWVVLKGFQTRIARSGGPDYVNGSGDAALAQGGTGDILAGYLAGLLARPSLAENPELAIRYAVWQHGAAADDLSRTRRSWTPEDLCLRLGEVTPTA